MSRRIEKCGIRRIKCQTDEKCGYSQKKHDCRYSTPYIFVVTVKNSLIADVERKENPDKIKKYIKRCKIFAYDGSINKIGCRNEYKSQNYSRYP